MTSNSLAPEERLPAALVAAMVAIGTLVAIVAMALGHASVARGAVAGAGLGAVYLIGVRRFVRAFFARSRGERLGPMDQVMLSVGMSGRLMLAAGWLAAVAKSHPYVDLWTTFLVFLSYRLLLGAYEIHALVLARKEPPPPPLGWESEEDTFIAREGRDLGRRRSRRQSR